MWKRQRARRNARLFEKLSEKCLKLDSQCLHTSSKTRDLARCGVGMNHTLRGCALDLGLSSLESALGDSSVARSDGFFDLADETTDPRTTSLVDCSTGSDLAGRLLRRSCVGHDASLEIQTKAHHCRVGSLRPAIPALGELLHGKSASAFPTVGGHIAGKRGCVNADSAVTAPSLALICCGRRAYASPRTPPCPLSGPRWQTTNEKDGVRNAILRSVSAQRSG